METNEILFVFGWSGLCAVLGVIYQLARIARALEARKEDDRG